jgi:hypothetical protein
MTMLTPKQILMLRTAVEHPDGIVLAASFGRQLHSETTAKALLKQGLIQYFAKRNGYYVYQLTDAGREAAEPACCRVARKMTAIKCPICERPIIRLQTPTPARIM